jgi:hypothetical protein
MGILNDSKPTPTRSKRTSTPPPSSAPSSSPPSDVAEQIAAVTAKLDELREAGEADRATIQALRDALAALKAAGAPASGLAAPARDRFRELFGGA